VDEATALVELGHALSTFVPKVTRLDPAHPLSLESATNWQRRIAEECLGRGAEVVFLRPIGLATGWRKQAEPFVAWVGFEFQRMDRQIRGLAKDLRVTLVRISVAPDRYWTPTDPFHPSTLGRATIARRIAKKIKRILRTR